MTSKSSARRGRASPPTELTRGCHSFSFPVTLMPTLLLDLTHLIAALALLEGAFEAGFSSVEDMLNRPTVDDKTSTPLRWKQEFLDQRICDMKCDAFRIYFKRLCIVSGLQNPPRPYFLRVGAGANFEGKQVCLYRPFSCHHLCLRDV